MSNKKKSSKFGRAVRKINNNAANSLSNVLSSMWLFWILAIILVAIGIIYPATDPFTFVMFWISAVFQAIALPVLAFVANIQGAKQEKTTREIHENVLEELRLIQKQLKMLQEQKGQLTEQDEQLEDIAGDTERIEKKLD